MHSVSTPQLYSATSSDESVSEFKSLLLRIKAAGAVNQNLAETVNADWTTYKVKAEVAYRYGNFAEAETAWLKALDQAQYFRADDPRRVYTFECLSSFYLVEKKLDKAEAYARQALYWTEQVYGQNDPRVAVCLNRLVDMYDKAGRWSDAEALSVRMLQIYYKNYGGDHAFVGAVANKLALLYHGQGKLDLAEMMYERAIPVRRKSLGERHPSYQALLDNYATLLEQTGRQGQASIFRGLPTEVDLASFECKIAVIKFGLS